MLKIANAVYSIIGIGTIARNSKKRIKLIFIRSLSSNSEKPNKPIVTHITVNTNSPISNTFQVQNTDERKT